MKIFLIGGGTGGSNTPVLAVGEALSKLDGNTELFLVGSMGGLEKQLLGHTNAKIAYLRIPAGKWRRYFSVRNITDLLKIVLGFLKSLYLLLRFRPAVIFGAGSFVQVPMSWAAYLLRIPVVIHQQDLQISLTTRLSAPTAKLITMAFSYSEKDLPYFSGLFKKVKKEKTLVTGNPVRKQVLEGKKEEGQKIFNLVENYPIVLIMGGGGGSWFLNNTVIAALPVLANYVQIIHVTGGRMKKIKNQSFSNYHAYDFLGPELPAAYACADLVISRAGMGTISELALLKKPAIIVPLPNSPQQDNARFLAYYKCASVVAEEYLTAELLVDMIRKILWTGAMQNLLKENIGRLMPEEADKKIAKLLLKIGRKNG